MATIVHGEGPSDAEIMLIGQNPGKEEIKQGKPFVGKSGKYLDAVLKKAGISRGRCYITSVVKAATPGNRRPKAEEVDYWMPHLIDEIRRIKPKIVVLMGRVAWVTPKFKGIEYIKTYHPAAAMRFPEARKQFEKDFLKLKEKVGKLTRKTRQER